MSDDNKDENSNGESPEDGPAPAGPLEIIATIVSALLIAGLIGVLVRDALHPNLPPAFEVRAEAMQSSGASYRVPLHVRNAGDESAKSVVVHVELTAADTAVSETEVTLDWLPGRSTREAVAVFSRRDAQAATGVRAEVRGYAVP
jgi:uncharacterized protein (TIGR02588 family)